MWSEQRKDDVMTICKPTNYFVYLGGLLWLFSAFPAAALNPSDVFERVKSSVFVVKAYDQQSRAIAQGSAVLISTGKLATNCHVLKGGNTFEVGRAGHFVPASLVAGDDNKDTCFLQASLSEGSPATVGQSLSLRVGVPVYAVGSPKGLELSMSDGIVSQLRGGPPPFIQTTAAISPGSSGGGLFDTEGNLVGLTTLYIDGAQSLNFAVPVEWLKDIPPGPYKAAQDEVTSVQWIQRGQALFEKKAWDGLKSWAEKWTQEKPHESMSWILLAGSYDSLKRPDDALNAMQRGLRYLPRDAGMWLFYGIILQTREQHSEAVTAFRQSLTYISENATAWFSLGWSLRELGQYSEAIGAYRRSSQINPNEGGVWIGLGNLYVKTRQYSDAINAYREATRVDPNDADAIYYLGALYAASGDHSAARDTVKQLRKINPEKAKELSNEIPDLSFNQPSVAAGKPTSGWIPISDPDEATYYVDPSTIRRIGNKSKVWILYDLKKATVDNNGKALASAKSQDEFDCKEEQSRSLHTVAYSGTMGRGHVVSTDSTQSQWTPVVPDSVREAIMKFVCAKR
jgi:tetratricopeptide (TPR) repeat protein